MKENTDTIFDTDEKVPIYQMKKYAKEYCPELVPKINEIFGMYNAYKIVEDKLILESIIMELSTIVCDLLLETVVSQSNFMVEPNSLTTWRAVIDGFVKYMKKKERSDSSIRIYRAAVKNKFEYQDSGDIDSRELRRRVNEVLREYETKVQEPKNHNERAAVRLFREFLEEELICHE